MKRNKFSPAQNQKPAGNSSQPTAAEKLNPGGIEILPWADEVARRAYFTYLNQGSMPGHDVQHWLAAEADLLAERNLTPSRPRR